MSITPGSAGPRESDEGTRIVPIIHWDSDGSVKCGVMNIALPREPTDEDDEMKDIEEEK